MPPFTRLILILALTTVPLTCGLAAQETTTATTATTTAATDTVAETTTSAETETPVEAASATPTVHTIRDEFSELLRAHPYELSHVLALDPRLLTNDEFLAGYPEVARYLSEHPEIAGNPRFYLAYFRTPQQDSVTGDILEGILIFSIFIFIFFVLSWFVRTVIEQKRWNRLSRQQSETHTKLLDRFGTSNELLEYIKTPAGSKFLESAPIPVYADRPVQNAPMTRVIWSIQIGVVVAAGALGMLLVSLRLDNRAAEELFAMGMIGFCVGIGFVASAVVAMVLSRRLGTFEQSDDPGVVR